VSIWCSHTQGGSARAATLHYSEEILPDEGLSPKKGKIAAKRKPDKKKALAE